MKKYIIAALAIVALLATTASAEVYNFGQGDLWQQLKYAFNSTSGHDHDGDNSKPVVGLGNSLVSEGATADAYETTIAITDPTADRTVTVPDAAGAMILSTAGVAQTASAIWGGTGTLVAEGATADDYETTLAFVDPTADQTASFPNFAVSYALLGSTLTTNTVDAANSVWGVSAGLVFEGSAADTSETTLTATNPTADRTVTVPDQTGTVQLSGAATALTAGAAVSLTVAPGVRLYTDTITTDNEDQTITFSGAGAAGDEITIIFVTDAAGSGDEVITFHSTLVRSTGTLTLANAAASRYVVRFMSDGTKWNEIGRTAVQAA